MSKLQKGLLICIDVLEAARSRVNEVLQSDEAKAFGRRVKTEANKDKTRLERTLRNKALRVVEQCEFQLAKIRSLLAKQKQEKPAKKRKK